MTRQLPTAKNSVRRPLRSTARCAITREMCSARLVFSTSKKIARRLVGSGRSGGAGATRAASAGSGTDSATGGSVVVTSATGAGVGTRSGAGGTRSGRGRARARPPRAERGLAADFLAVATIPPLGARPGAAVTGAPGGPGQCTRLRLAARASSQRTVGDRIALRLRRRNTVLPLPAGGTIEHVRGARVERRRRGHPLGPLAALETKPARARQRDADHHAEHRRVAVPSDAGAGRVMRDEHFDELVRGHATDRGCACAQRQEEVGDRRARLDAPRLVAIGPAEVRGAPPRHLPAHLDLVKVQRRDPRQRRALLVGREEVGTIDEAGRRVAHQPSIPTVGGWPGFWQDSAPHAGGGRRWPTQDAWRYFTEPASPSRSANIRCPIQSRAPRSSRSRSPTSAARTCITGAVSRTTRAWAARCR